MANGKRLIDAYSLIEDIEKRYCEPCKAEGKDYHEVACRACWVDDMILEIDPAPTVDAVEVVRCKNCKKWRENWIAGIESGVCICGKPRRTKPHDFCSYGERKDKE